MPFKFPFLPSFLPSFLAICNFFFSCWLPYPLFLPQIFASLSLHFCLWWHLFPALELFPLLLLMLVLEQLHSRELWELAEQHLVLDHCKLLEPASGQIALKETVDCGSPAKSLFR